MLILPDVQPSALSVSAVDLGVDLSSDLAIDDAIRDDDNDTDSLEIDLSSIDDLAAGDYVLSVGGTDTTVALTTALTTDALAALFEAEDLTGDGDTVSRSGSVLTITKSNTDDTIHSYTGVVVELTGAQNVDASQVGQLNLVDVGADTLVSLRGLTQATDRVFAIDIDGTTSIEIDSAIHSTLAAQTTRLADQFDASATTNSTRISTSGGRAETLAGLSTLLSAVQIKQLASIASLT